MTFADINALCVQFLQAPLKIVQQFSFDIKKDECIFMFKPSRVIIYKNEVLIIPPKPIT